MVSKTIFNTLDKIRLEKRHGKLVFNLHITDTEGLLSKSVCRQTLIDM